MTPEAWARIKRISDEAWERPPEARAAFLADACGDDVTLLEDVSSFLASVAEAETLFETPAVALPSVSSLLAHAQRPTTLIAGTIVGSYRLVREIGHGGMGAVYLAERADGAYDQQVAIKFVGMRLASPALVDRFREERRILARLTHPNIARLLDGGTMPDGLPFVVMEYVPGVPVTEFAETRQLSVRARIELFRSICAAVHYAHQRLVIHRDLKAGNILVTPDAVPKLLDFGIATLAEPGDGSVRERTRIRALTPESASPEQLRGDPITIAADVYALGALLYRLLAGVSPYEDAFDSDVALMRAICEVDPAPPSAHLRERALTIPADLDAIVLKALHKAPERRYASVEQLSDDLARFLNGLPVRAAPDSRAYRLGKFLRRHTALVTTASCAVIAVLGGAGISTYQAHVARQERARAERRFDDVRRLANSVLFEVNDAIADVPGALSARRLIVKRVADYLDELSPDAQGHVPLQRELAAAYQRLGDILGGGGISNLGDFPGAEAAYLKAQGVRQQLAALASPDPADLDALAQLDVDLSRYFGASGRFDRAEESAAAAVSILESATGVALRIDAYAGHLATAYQQLGFTQARNNNDAGSLASLERATALGRQQVAERPADAREAVRLSRIEADYSQQLLPAGRAPEALVVLEDARTRLQRVLAADPVNTRYRQTLLLTLRDEAETYRALGDRRRAIDALGEAVRTGEALRDADPRDQAAQTGVMMVHYSLGVVLLSPGAPAEHDAGVARLEQAIGEATAIVKASPGNNFVLNELATLNLDLGEAQLRRKPADAAGCRHIAQGLKIWDELATRAQIPAESERSRTHFESLLRGCDVTSAGYPERR